MPVQNNETRVVWLIAFLSDSIRKARSYFPKKTGMPFCSCEDVPSEDRGVSIYSGIIVKASTRFFHVIWAQVLTLKATSGCCKGIDCLISVNFVLSKENSWMSDGIQRIVIKEHGESQKIQFTPQLRGI